MEESLKDREESMRDGLKIALSAWSSNENPVSDMIGLLGYDLTMKMLLVFGGRSVQFPRLSELVDFINLAAAAKFVEDGATVYAACHEFSVTRKQLNLICGKLKALRIKERSVQSKRTEVLKSVGL